MAPKEFLTLTIEPYGMRSEFKEATLLLDALRSTDLKLRSDCGGRGICGKCRVMIKDSSKVSAVGELFLKFDKSLAFIAVEFPSFFFKAQASLLVIKNGSH